MSPFGSSSTGSGAEGAPQLGLGRLPRYLQVRHNGVDVGDTSSSAINFDGPLWEATRGTGEAAETITAGLEG